MAEKLSYHVNSFADKVRLLNQTGAKNLTLSADDARNLHSDIFALLAKIAELTDSANPTIDVDMDGGKF